MTEEPTEPQPESRKPLSGGAVAGGVIVGLVAVPISLLALGGLGAAIGPVGLIIAPLVGIVGWVFALRAILKADRSLGLGMVWGFAGAIILFGGCVALIAAAANGPV
jgi:hypothetical protein